MKSSEREQIIARTEGISPQGSEICGIGGEHKFLGRKNVRNSHSERLQAQR